MNGPGPVRRRYLLLLAPLVCASIAFPAARSDAADGAKVSPTEVAEGLSTIHVIVGDVVSAGANKAKATMIAEGIDPIWARIEGTIKANDSGSYTTMEKGLEGLVDAARSGDAAKASGAAGVIASAVKFYTAKFPGDAKAAAAPGPAPASERKAAAAPEAKPAAPEAKSAPAEAKSAPAESNPAPAESKPAGPASAESRAAAADPTAPAAPGGTLARTGGTGTLTALAGAAFGLGGLAVVGGARRRRVTAAG